MYIQESLSPKKNQPFIWFAKAHDDTLLTEFEDDCKENSFNDINKDTLKEFGILGRGVKLFFSAEDGIIRIIDKKIDCYIEEDDGNILELSARPGAIYNDIIQFKQFHKDFDINTKNALGVNVIDAYHFGYKHTISTERGSFTFQFIFRMPIGQPMKLGFRLTSSFHIKGKLIASINGLEDKNPTEIELSPAGDGNPSVRVYEKDFF